MSKKKGRPKKAIIQEKNIGFYVTFAQYAIIQRKAEEADLQRLVVPAGPFVEIANAAGSAVSVVKC